MIILRGLRGGYSYENAKIKEGVLVGGCSRDKPRIGEFVNVFVGGRRWQEKEERRFGKMNRRKKKMNRRFGGTNRRFI